MIVLYQVFYILHIDVWFRGNFPSYFNINFNLQSQQYFFFQFLARAPI